jgi:CheY-like chemotaxis protein
MMNKKGAILIIDDDKDDREIMGEVFKKLDYSNPILYFSDGQEALNYLLDDDGVPFIILSDVNMPKLNGLELREIIQNNEVLRMKSIPFMFFTTATSKKAIWQAYNLSVQGFFIKPTSFQNLEASIKRIIDYWLECKSPSDYP